MGKASRAKGRRGQSEAIDLLTSRDWSCADLSAGLSTEDIFADDPDGERWCVEVKNTASINVRAARKQAIENAQKRKAGKWMVMARIDGYGSFWLVLRQGMKPCLWSVGNA